MKSTNLALRKVFRYKILLVAIIASCRKAIIYKNKDKISSIVLEKISRGEEISDDEIIQNLNEQDDEGKTLLILAVEKENKKLVDRLINLGIDTTIKDEDGNTALMIAEERNSIEIISLLNNASAASSSSTALALSSTSFAALPSGSEDDSIEDIPPHYTPKLSTPMINAINSYNLDAIKELLRDNEEALQERNSDGDTPLIVAIRSEKDDIVSLFLDHPQIDQTIDSVNTKGEGTLHCAIEVENIALCTTILEKGANININNNYDTPLILAIRKGDLGITELLLSNNADPNIPNSKGETALMIATEMCDVRAVEILIKLEVDLLTENEKEENVLFYAIRSANIAIVREIVGIFFKKSIEIQKAQKRKIVDYFIDLEKKDHPDYQKIKKILQNIGINILKSDKIRKKVEDLRKKAKEQNSNITILAIEELKDEEDRKEILNLLISNLTSEEINRVDKKISALIYTIEREEVEIVRLLLSNASINVNITSERRKTALMIAVEIGNLEIIEALLKRNPDIKKLDTRGRTAINYALEKCDLKVLELFYESGKLQNHTDALKVMKLMQNGSRTTLIEAVDKGSLTAVKMLINSSNVNEKENGTTSLILASQKGYKEILDILLEHNANLEDIDKDSCTALIRAAENGHNTIVQTLIAYDANLEATDEERYTALMLAAYNDHNEVVETLLAHSANLEAITQKGFTALMIAAQNGHNDVVTTLLSNNANLEASSNKGFTALMIAAQHGYNEVVETLLAHNANLEASSNKGFTVLMIAAQNGHNEIVTTLLAHNANLEASSNKGFTALMIAAQKCHNEITTTLLAHNANLEAKSKLGNTALMIAAQKGHNEIVTTLLDKGADIEARDKVGLTVLMIAKQNGHNKVVTTLLDRGANNDNLYWMTSNCYTNCSIKTNYGVLFSPQITVAESVYTTLLDKGANNSWVIPITPNYYTDCFTRTEILWIPEKSDKRADFLATSLLPHRTNEMQFHEILQIPEKYDHVTTSSSKWNIIFSDKRADFLATSLLPHVNKSEPLSLFRFPWTD